MNAYESAAKQGMGRTEQMLITAPSVPMDEARLKAIEAHWVGSLKCYDSLREVFAALREAWKRIEELEGGVVNAR